MFPSGPEGFDVQQLLQQAQRMQQQLMSAQQDLAEQEVTGSAGGGLVRATVTGAGELVSLDIDPSVVDPTDVETLCDLVVAAVRDANAQVQRLAAEQMGPLGPELGGLLGGTPGAGPTAGTEATAAPTAGSGPTADAGPSADPTAGPSADDPTVYPSAHPSAPPSRPGS